MLKFLTHKLRTHSLNEENPHHKVEDDDHDSGTESDDEHADTEEPETSMDSSETEVDMCSGAGASAGTHRYHATAGTVSPYFIDSALPSDSDLNYDHHSSEEELEVINSSCCTAQGSPPHLNRHLIQQVERSTGSVSAITTAETSLGSASLSVDAEQQRQLQRHNHQLYQDLHHHHLHHEGGSSGSSGLLRVNSCNNNNNDNSSCSNDSTALITRSRSASTLPEKRKWSQVTLESSNSSSNTDQGFIERCDDGGRSSQNAYTPTGVPIRRSDLSSGSSDEEVQGLLATPVQFRTSPPRGAHRPGRSFSPPPKLFHYASGQDSSPRKRHRQATPHAIQRPCLDFEKMQQLKARAVTAWRHSGDHGGELSVFCW